MKKILVVVDMQKDFMDDKVLGNAECRAIIPKIVEKINSDEYKNAYIIATRDTHQENYLETQEGKNLPVVHCIRDTDGWQIVDEIADALDNHGCMIINKITFGSYKLVEEVRKFVDSIIEQGEEPEIELCGVCTGICVISNAMLLKAALTEVPIVIDSECCACVSVDSHKTALEAMKLCQIKIK